MQEALQTAALGADRVSGLVLVIVVVVMGDPQGRVCLRNSPAIRQIAVLTGPCLKYQKVDGRMRR